MFRDVLTHEYFWLSFLPISFLGVGFWMLFFERESHRRNPIILLFMALSAGVLSAMTFAEFGEAIDIENFWAKIVGEEFFKVVFAIVTMEIVEKRFKSVAGGVIYGFCVGLGFAFAENMVYLTRAYEEVQFAPQFWLTFQGRFWSSTLLHGITTATFGLFYSGAYLAKTVNTKDHESPLHALFSPFTRKNFWQIITFHISRKHLLFAHHPTLEGHFARGVIFEGFLIAVIVHSIFNVSLDTSVLNSALNFASLEFTLGPMHPEIAFGLAFGGMWFLREKVRQVS